MGKGEREREREREKKKEKERDEEKLIRNEQINMQISSADGWQIVGEILGLLI